MNNIVSVVSVPTFGDFVAEVEPGPVVRLCLGEKYAPEKYGSGDNVLTVPAKQITLDAQGFNHEGELVWLSRASTIRWSNDGPAMDDDRGRYDGMTELRRIVLARLEALGYEVLAGRYVLPNDLLPINGHFDCAEWYRDAEKLIRVRAVVEPVTTPAVQLTRFEVSLQDGCSTSPADTLPVPIEIRADRSSVLVRIPAVPDDIYSAAEVYVEHYNGRVTVYVRDQETMIADPGGDATASIVLLTDAANRELDPEGEQDAESPS